MTSTTKQSLNTSGLLSDGYTNRLLNLIEVPEGSTVSAIILAHDSGSEVMKAHFNPLVEDQFLAMSQWWDGADVHAHTYRNRFDEIAETAKRRWPEARVFVVPGGCLCCNGVENLLEYNCER